MDPRLVALHLPQALAKTPQDSEERFRARALWPGYAKRLRDAGPATPVVARIVAGASDKEETISALYGGKADTPGVSLRNARPREPSAAWPSPHPEHAGATCAAPQLTDELYLAFGRVLTISGRTIRPEAQADPEPSQSAQKAVENLLAQVSGQGGAAFLLRGLIPAHSKSRLA